MGALELLTNLLRVDSTNPPGNEEPAAEILRDFCAGAGLKTEIFRSPEGRTNLVARLEGPRDRPALVLLSHSDVVGVEADRWTHDPFGAETADGAIWGRGALDMKGIAAMHARAAAALVEGGREPTREVIVVAVADEEAGGKQGARWLCDEHAHEIGFSDDRPPPEVLGEGAFGLADTFERPLVPIVMGEKSALWLELVARGQPGHGALPPRDQAPHNLARAIDAVAGFGPPRIHPVMRRQFGILANEASGPGSAAFKLLASGGGRAAAAALKPVLRKRGAIATLLSDTVTPTQITAGYKHNVVPGEARAALDCRLLPNTDHDHFARAIERKVKKHGVTVEVTSTNGGPVSDPSSLYGLLEEESARLPGRPVVVPSLTAGITDVRYFRQRGAAGYGWVPMILSSELLATIHGHDERVVVEDFERAVEAMTRVVGRAAGAASF